MKNQHSQIVERISKILSEKFLVGDGHLDFDANTELLSSGLCLDSVVLLRLVAAIEDEVGIKFNDDDMSFEIFSSVGTLAEAVRQKLNNGLS